MDKSYIPTKETALLWPHLRNLADKLPPLQDCDVGLLIGYDCPAALIPREVILGDKNQPLAQRSELEWSIIGLSNPTWTQGSQSYEHQLTVKEMPVPLTTDVLKTLESNFIEGTYKDKYVSQEDVNFVQFLSNHITYNEDGHYEMPLPFKGNSPPNLPHNKRKIYTLQGDGGEFSILLNNSEVAGKKIICSTYPQDRNYTYFSVTSEPKILSSLKKITFPLVVETVQDSDGLVR